MVGLECCNCNYVFRGNHYTSGQHFKHELVGYTLEKIGFSS